MMSVLKRDFVEHRITSIPYIPTEWSLGPGYFYQLSLKMCQIRSLEYGFTWGQRQPTKKKDSIIEEPDRIVQLDISLNEIVALQHEHLAPFSQLRVLNASLNRLERFVGVETLRHLRQLDLSHNRIHKLEGLGACQTLVCLNLSMNELHNISLMPNLGQLRELHINNNNLKSLEGVQALPQLQDLHVQRNELTDIIALSSNLRLKTLNAAENHIKSFTITLSVLQGLKRLQSVTLQGNPIDREVQYHEKMTELPSLTLLDNISVRPHPREPYVPQDGSLMTSIDKNTTQHAQYPAYNSSSFPAYKTGPQYNTYGVNLHGIKESTRQAFMDHIAEKRQAMEENVRFLQKRIMSLQDEFREYEKKTMNDLDSCLRYLDTLSFEEAKRYSTNIIPGRSEFRPPPQQFQPIPAPYSRGENHPMDEEDTRQSRFRQKPDYRDIKDTDEVLRCAYNELIMDETDEIQ